MFRLPVGRNLDGWASSRANGRRIAFSFNVLQINIPGLHLVLIAWVGNQYLNGPVGGVADGEPFRGRQERRVRDQRYLLCLQQMWGDVSSGYSRLLRRSGLSTHVQRINESIARTYSGVVAHRADQYLRALPVLQSNRCRG